MRNLFCSRGLQGAMLEGDPDLQPVLEDPDKMKVLKQTMKNHRGDKGEVEMLVPVRAIFH